MLSKSPRTEDQRQSEATLYCVQKVVAARLREALPHHEGGAHGAAVIALLSGQFVHAPPYKLCVEWRRDEKRNVLRRCPMARQLLNGWSRRHADENDHAIHSAFHNILSLHPRRSATCGW